jgi:tetratricopeptide (TPR) repeat protein
MSWVDALRPGRSCLPALVVVVLGGASVVTAQHHERPLPADFNEPIRLYSSGLGSFTRPISSPDAGAKAYFNQGFQLMYAFAKVEAGRSFREAQRRDPNCAICYWGEAWAWGPYVNGRMTAPHAQRAYEAIQEARARAPAHANAQEQALIDAMTLRYARDFDPATQGERDRAYAGAMARVAGASPRDPDVATLYAEALFLLLPRPRTFDVGEATVARVLGTLEGALGRNPRHVGACHLYIHMTELTAEPQRAEACAEHLGSSIPGASHINHMPAHTWTRVGRWGDAVRASLQAWESDQKAARGEGFATYPAHDLQMLAFSASMDGQGGLAIRAGRGLTTIAADPMYHALTLVRFGRFEEAASLGPRPSHDIRGGMWDFARGYAELRRGNTNAAREYLARIAAAGASSRALFKMHTANSLLGIVGGILEGEIERASGNPDKAVGAFARAVALQDSLIVDDPHPLPFTARHWLGAILLDEKRFVEAERVYNEDLVRHPRNGWALAGLRQALGGQGKPTDSIEEAFRRSWVRADTPLRTSRF